MSLVCLPRSPPVAYLCLVRQYEQHEGTVTTRPGTIALVLALVGVFGLELATHSAGNDPALLKLGALPDSGELHGQYWRIATYSFLHFNSVHLLVNALLLFWIAGILEKRMGVALTGAIYFCSVLSSAFVILLVHSCVTVGVDGLCVSGNLNQRQL